MSEIGSFGLSAPSSDRDADRTGGFGRELQTSRWCHGESGDFADHAREAAVTKAFLETGQNGFFRTTFGVDHAVRMKAGLRQRGREEIAPADAPKNLPVCPGQNTGREQGRRRAVKRAIRPSCHLMEGT